MTAPKIITRNIYPPIPIRQFDWMACYDGDEPDDNGNMDIGYGPTEADAIEDLRRLMREKEEAENGHDLP